MNKIRATIILSVVMAFGSAAILFTSCSDKEFDGSIIITQGTGKIQDIVNDQVYGWQNFQQMRIVVYDPEESGGKAKVLTEGFYSAHSPVISYDGNSMLFTAKKNPDDPWQIWEMNLLDSKIRKIISFPENCIDPDYLPGGRLIFSKVTVKDTARTARNIFVCNLDGSDLRQITFSPNPFSSLKVLQDGRILAINRQMFPVQGDQAFFVLRPDGTKADRFYKGPDGSILRSCGRETADNKIIFIESEKNSLEKGNLISINYNRPLNSRIDLSSGLKGSFRSAFPLESGRILVSYRPVNKGRYSLYEFDSENMVPDNPIYADPDYDILEAVVVSEYKQPKKLPSEVDKGVKTGFLLCTDINFNNMMSSGTGSAFPQAGKIEVLGIDSTMGIVNVEKDGSFYLKVIANTPFRIQTLDDNDNVLHGPCDWIWLRPNERRGCIGCHEDRELSPDNKMALSVKKPPVNVPVHISKIREKEIELE